MDFRMGKQRRCLFNAMEPGETGFNAGAAVHAWRPSPSPLAPSSPALRERTGERRGGSERTVAPLTQ